MSSTAVSKTRDKGQIIDPNGMSLFRLTMMVVTASICGGIFSLAGDMAAGGANTGAVLVSWAICFVGVFALMMCFIGVFVLYLFISVLSLGIMPRAEMAELATPSMAGILEHAIGPVGAAIVNLGVVLSLMGAMLGYVIISAETPFEAARQGVFPKAFAKMNKNEAPLVTTLVSAGITQLFLIVSVFSESTYQFFYACAVNTILVPYVCSAAYYMKIAWQNKHLENLGKNALAKARFFGTLGFIYTVFLVWTGGVQGVMITTILFTPGIIVYAIGQRQRNKPILPNAVDKVIAAIIVIAMVVSIYLIATGTFTVF